MDERDNKKLEKIHRILNNLGDKALKITSGNLSHNVAIHKATLTNVQIYLIDELVPNISDNEDLKCELLFIRGMLDYVIFLLNCIKPEETNLKYEVWSYLKDYAKQLEQYLEN